MSYCYERILSASTNDAVREVLIYAEREHHNTTLYLGARCYRSAIGPPQIKGRGLRWFDIGQDPDQLWLPFERYIPAKIHAVYTNRHREYGDGWAIVCQDRLGRDREFTYHAKQTEGDNRMIAFSLYLRRHGRRRLQETAAIAEIYGLSGNTPSSILESQPSLPPPGFTISDSALLVNSYVRAHLERSVSDIEETAVLLNPDTGIFYSSDNGAPRALAHILHSIQDPGHGRINFLITSHRRAESAYSVAVWNTLIERAREDETH